MSIGPVEILVISFPGNKFNGDVAPALAELVQTGLIKVIDLVFVAKDAAGDVVAVELSELDEATGAAFRPHVEEPSGMLAEEDIEDLAADLARNRRPRSSCSSTSGPRDSVTRSSTPAASCWRRFASRRKPSTKCSRPTEPRTTRVHRVTRDREEVECFDDEDGPS